MWELIHDGETYNIQTKIGEGCTAEVYKATNMKKQTICVKLINQDFMKHNLGKSLIENQTNLLSQLRHQFLLRFITRKYNKAKQLMIVTEYCQGGTLYDYLRKKGKVLQKESVKIMRQVIEGCSYMHSQGVLHRDLKPENIFFKSAEKKDIKIADFGFAVNLKDTKLISANVGSPLYMPHESLSDKKFSTQSDVFAIGVIWYELLTGRTPFQAATERDLQEKTKKEQIRSLSMDCHQKIKEVIIRCLKARPQDRPALSDLMATIEEVVSLNKTKSKSVFLASEKEQLKEKFNKASSKENINPNTKKPVTRHQRSTTQMQPKQAKTSGLNKKQSVILGQTISYPIPSLSKEDMLSLLKKLSEAKLIFLPSSVQDKFIVLLRLYEKLVTGKQSGKGQQASQDELIVSLESCKTEQDFCISSFSFLRRLLRLAKTYKEFGSTTEDLSKLWEHVQAKCLSK